MSQRAIYLAVAGAVLVAIGLFALRFPVHLDDYDQWGRQIDCGSGYGADLVQATEATGAKDFVDECQSALTMRRAWTIPLVTVGGLALLGVLLVATTTSIRHSLLDEDESP